MTVRALRGDVGELEATDRARRTRIAAFVRRALAEPEVDALALLAEGSSDPVLLAPIVQPAPADAAERLTDELAAALADDAAQARATRYKVLAQAEDETVAVLQLRVRAEATDGPLDATLRRVGENQADALLRQLMRHQEALMRLTLERDARRAEADAKREDRIAARLEELERRASESADRRVELMRAEAEIAMQLAETEQRQELQRAAVRQFLPAAAQLAHKVTAHVVGGAKVSSQSAPAQRLADDPDPDARHAVRVLAALRALPADSAELLASMVPEADGAALRAAYSAGRKLPPPEGGQ